MRLLDPREQEDRVVGGKPECDREEQHRLGQLERALAAVVEEALEPAVLEDQHEQAEGGREPEHVHQQRLQRQHDRSGDDVEQPEREDARAARARRAGDVRGSRPCRDTTPCGPTPPRSGPAECGARASSPTRSSRRRAGPPRSARGARPDAPAVGRPRFPAGGESPPGSVQGRRRWRRCESASRRRAGSGGAVHPRRPARARSAGARSRPLR